MSRLSARVRNNLEVVARTNALKPGTIPISFGDSPAEQAEQRYYTECLNRFALEHAREQRQTPGASSPTRRVGQPIRFAARPRERRAQRATRSTSSNTDDPDLADEPPPGWRSAHAAWGRSS